MAPKPRTKSTTEKTVTTITSVKPDWIQRLDADAEKTEYFLSHITADAECFLSRICTTFQKFENGEVRVLKQEPVISARLGKLSADGVKQINRYLADGVGDFYYISFSPSQKIKAVSSVMVGYEKDEIISEHENYIIREVSNIFIHSADEDEIEDYELTAAILVFKDEANPNFACDRKILRKCVAFASELATTPATSTTPDAKTKSSNATTTFPHNRAGAAKHLKISVSQLDKEVKAKRIIPERIGTRVLFSEHCLQFYVNSLTMVAEENHKAEKK